MPSSLPSPDNNYAAPVPMVLNKAAWDAALVSIGQRLVALEAYLNAYQTYIDDAVSDTVAALAPDLAALQTTITALQAQVAAAQDAIAQIVTGSVPASAVSETAGRIWLTPTQRDAWDSAIAGRYTIAATDAAITAAIDNLKAGVGSAYDTLQEIAAYITSDTAAGAAILGALDLRLRVDTGQTFTATQQAQARSNVGAASMAGMAQANILLNSDCTIAQETVATAVTSGYVADQWVCSKTGSMAVSAQKVSDAPAGYNHSIRLTITTPQASLASGDRVHLYQPVEVSRVRQLALGTAFAKQSRIGGWVKSSVPGAYSIALVNSTGSTPDQSWVGNFAISAANQWEYKTLVVPATAAGTWQTALSSLALSVMFTLACGSSLEGVAGWQSGDKRGVAGNANLAATNAATFQQTGWMWLPGSDFPSADDAYLLRPDFYESLRQCQRYWAKSYRPDVLPGANTGYSGGIEDFFGMSRVRFPVPMRADATVTIYDDVGNVGKISLNDVANTAPPASPDNISHAGFKVWSVNSTNRLRFHWVANARL